MSEKRLVMARAWGLPFTRLNRRTGPPSRCFCSPVISRSGSTSTSVSSTSPSALRNSRALRSEVTSGLMPIAFGFSCSVSAVVDIVALLVLGKGEGQLQPQPSRKDLVVVLAQARRGPAHTPGRPHELVGDHAVAVAAELRVFLLLPHPAGQELGVREEVPHRAHHRGVDPVPLEQAHDLGGPAGARPRRQRHVQLALVFPAVLGAAEAGVAGPGGPRGPAAPLPLLLVPAADHAPAPAAAGVA